jgi:oligopeptide transport system substrate-binding protein
LQDKNIHEAFDYAFDRAAYCDEIARGLRQPTLSWIRAGVPGAIESDAYALDSVAARRALAESTYGAPDGLPEISWYYAETYPAAQEEAERLAKQFRDALGIQMNLVPSNRDTLNAMFYTDPAA